MIKVTIDQWLPAINADGKPTRKAVQTLRIFGVAVYIREILLPHDIDERYVTDTYLTRI